MFRINATGLLYPSDLNPFEGSGVTGGYGLQPQGCESSRGIKQNPRDVVSTSHCVPEWVLWHACPLWILFGCHRWSRPWSSDGAPCSPRKNGKDPHLTEPTIWMNDVELTTLVSYGDLTRTVWIEFSLIYNLKKPSWRQSYGILHVVRNTPKPERLYRSFDGRNCILKKCAWLVCWTDLRPAAPRVTYVRSCLK